MKQQVSTAKWIGMLLLQIPLYLMTSYVMMSLLGGSYRLLVKAGANLPPNLLLQHFLLVSPLDGFLAGLLGVLTIRAMMLLPSRLHASSGPAWKRPQAWTWVISTCWFVFGILVWAATSGQHSVLATSSSLTISNVISKFFGGGCDLSDAILSQSVLGACMTQLSYTHPWLGTIGYSAAAFIPARWTKRLNNSPDSAEQLEISAQEQRPEPQVQPGEVLR